MKLNANITGTDALLRKFSNYGTEGIKKFEAITKISALEIEADAKTTVQSTISDNGQLAQSIKSEAINPLNYKVLATEKYAPYIEFGTGGLVDVPKGWESLAIQFIGKGIKKVNLPARPYMHPAFVKGSKQYIIDLNMALRRLATKFNT